jgi:uncharacterized protein (DUF1330 family)
MSKGYIIALITVRDSDRYAGYLRLATEAIEALGGNVLVRGGKCQALEGELPSRTVVVEFPDFETARAFYHSAEYTKARRSREDAADVDILVVEGI